MHDAHDATDAAMYTRQLYTAFGVGRSSLSVRRPMVIDVQTKLLVSYRVRLQVQSRMRWKDLENELDDSQSGSWQGQYICCEGLPR